MPFQPMDLSAFANMLLQQQRQNQPPNIMEEFKKGYQLSQMPEQEARKKEQENLANALKRAQTEKLQQESQNPYGNLQGDAKNILSMDLLKKMRPDLYEEHMASEAKKEKAKNIQEHAFNWRNTPATAKIDTIATYAGMGVSAAQASNLAAQGIYPEDYAKEKGIDLKFVKKAYPLTSTTQTRQQQRNSSLAETKTISEEITPWLAKVPAKIWGVPTNLLDVLGKMSNEDIGKILASRALSTEVSAARLKTAGAEGGEKAIANLNRQYLGEFKFPPAFLNKEIIESMNKFTEDVLSKGVNSYNDALDVGAKYGYGSDHSEENKNKKSNPIIKVEGAPTGSTRFQVGKDTYTVPDAEVEDFLKDME